MKRRITIALCAALAAAGCTGSPPSSTSDLGKTQDLAGRVVDMTDLTAIDPLAGNPKVVKVNVGPFKYAQSPLWLASANSLLFADPPSNVIHQLVLPTTLTPFRTASSGSSGLALDPQGNLIVCEFATHQLTRRVGSTYNPIVSTYMGTALNGPNDVTVRRDGAIYFTDPGAAGPPAFDGLYLVAPGGTTAVLLDKTMKFPDGLALAPDDMFLYVAAATDGKVYKFPVNGDGTLGSRNDFAIGLNNCGGLATDDAGNVYVATPSGVRVFKEDGTPRGSLAVPESTLNVGFGGSDAKTLFITGPTSLYSVNLLVPGRP